MKLVYFAGPYRAPTAEGIEGNVRSIEAQARAVWRKLGGYGTTPLWLPLIPHSIGHLLDPSGTFKGDAFWLGVTLALLRRCDALYLGTGWEASAGSRGEKALAEALGMPIFTEPEALFEWLRRAPAGDAGVRAAATAQVEAGIRGKVVPPLILQAVAGNLEVRVTAGNPDIVLLETDPDGTIYGFECYEDAAPLTWAHLPRDQARTLRDWLDTFLRGTTLPEVAGRLAAELPVDAEHNRKINDLIDEARAKRAEPAPPIPWAEGAPTAPVPERPGPSQESLERAQGAHCPSVGVGGSHSESWAEGEACAHCGAYGVASWMAAPPDTRGSEGG